MPQIRRTFIREGLTLARHYTYSYCAPSRQALLSGRQPIHVNEENSVCGGIPRGMSTLGDVLASAGYRTHWVGKWHCGFADPTATPLYPFEDSSRSSFVHELCLAHYESGTAGCRELLRLPEAYPFLAPHLKRFLEDFLDWQCCDSTRWARTRCSSAAAARSATSSSRS